MRPLAYDPSGNLISADQFFSSEPEFMENRELAESVTRTLKTLMRHPESADIIAEKRDSTYFLSFEGEHRKYVLSFEIGAGLILTGLE